MANPNVKSDGSNHMKVYTIGFTKKSAEEFFTRLKRGGVKRLIDIRLHPQSQLSGFAKKDDLKFFLSELLNIEYIHLQFLAPTKDMFDRYKKQKCSWVEYQDDFLYLISTRRIEQQLDRSLLADSCLLCSEDKPDKCHRRLIVEYLQKKWGDIEIVHL